MVSLKEYREQVKEELDNEEIPDCKILIGYELSCLTDAAYRLIDKLKGMEEYYIQKAAAKQEIKEE